MRLGKLIATTNRERAELGQCIKFSRMAESLNSEIKES